MSRLLKHDGRKAHRGVCALQAMRCKQIGVSMAASAQIASAAPELLRQIAVPMKGVDFAP
jgi:hypothetical protein